MAISGSQFEFVQGVVGAYAGLQLAKGSEALVESRILAVAQARRINSALDFFKSVERGQIADLDYVLAEAMADKETSFFRDVLAFEALRKQTIPELREKRSGDRKLSIWSAGCSTGQEAYSVAVMIREYFPDLQDWTIEIFASDLSRESVAAAQQGGYSQNEVNRGMPAPLLLKYLLKNGPYWYVKDEVRAMIQFSPLNLIEPWPSLPPMDLILFRHVLHGLQTEAKKDVLRRMSECLRPDGYLLLGAKETTAGLDDSYQEVKLDKAVFFRKQTNPAS